MLSVAVVTPTADGRTAQVCALLNTLIGEAWDELSIVYDRKSCPADARNRGWRSSHCDLIAFIDDDVLVDPGAIERARLHFEADHDLVLGQAAVRGGFVTSPTFMFLTTCMFVRRSWLHAMDGFDERFGYAKPEADLEFGWRTLEEGGKVAFLSDVTVDHPNESWSSWSDENVELMQSLYPGRWSRMIIEQTSWAVQ